MEFGDFLQRVKQIPSTTTLDECSTVFNMVRDLPLATTIIETGTGLGRMTLTMGLALNNRGVLITMDSYQDSARYGAEVKHTWGTTEAQRNVQTGGISDGVVYQLGDSIKLLQAMPDNYADFIYLDGNHKYTFVVEEIREALRVLKPGGILAGHDFHPGYEEGLLVMKAVMEHFIVGNNVSRLKLQGRIWSVVK